MTIELPPYVVDGVAIYRNAIKGSLDKIKLIEHSAEIGSGFNHGWQKAAVVSSDGNSEVTNSRTNMVLYLDVDYPETKGQSLSKINRELHSVFSDCVNHYAEMFCFAINTEKSRSYTVLTYVDGQYYVHHLDSSKNTPRTVSAVGYLNDDYIGGELDFNQLNFTYRPLSGDVVVFLSGEPFSHASLPVKSGIKYSVVNWW